MALSRDAKYGYVFRNWHQMETVAADDRRGWGVHGIIIQDGDNNTIMLVPALPMKRWNEYGTFLEFLPNSRDATGNVLDWRNAKTEYQYKDRQTGKEVSVPVRQL